MTIHELTIEGRAKKSRGRKKTKTERQKREFTAQQLRDKRTARLVKLSPAWLKVLYATGQISGGERKKDRKKAKTKVTS